MSNDQAATPESVTPAEWDLLMRLDDALPKGHPDHRLVIEAGMALVRKEGGERTFGPCPKCGGTDIHVAFHDGKGEKFYPGTVVYLACEHSKPCGINGKGGEHLAVHCRRCGLDWFEQPGAQLQASLDLFGTLYQLAGALLLNPEHYTPESVESLETLLLDVLADPEEWTADKVHDEWKARSLLTQAGQKE